MLFAGSIVYSSHHWQRHYLAGRLVAARRRNLRLHADSHLWCSIRESEGPSARLQYGLHIGQVMLLTLAARNTAGGAKKAAANGFIFIGYTIGNIIG